MNSDRLIELMEEAGLEPFSYSGRGMCGGRCVALNVERGESAAKPVAHLMNHLAAKHLESTWGTDDGSESFADMEARADELLALCNLLGSAREDSMGLDGVVYWPGADWPKEG